MPTITRRRRAAEERTEDHRDDGNSTVPVDKSQDNQGVVDSQRSDTETQMDRDNPGPDDLEPQFPEITEPYKEGSYLPPSIRRQAKDYSDDVREEYLGKGWALPGKDGGPPRYPIGDCGDVTDAIDRANSQGKPGEVVSFIKKRWKELGCGGAEPFSTTASIRRMAEVADGESPIGARVRVDSPQGRRSGRIVSMGKTRFRVAWLDGTTSVEERAAYEVAPPRRPKSRQTQAAVVAEVARMLHVPMRVARWESAPISSRPDFVRACVFLASRPEIDAGRVARALAPSEQGAVGSVSIGLEAGSVVMRLATSDAALAMELARAAGAEDIREVSPGVVRCWWG